MSTPIESREYQERIVNKTFQAFTTEQCGSVLIESPTGSGKSVMGLQLLKRLEGEYGYTFGWVAMRRKLLLQAQKENERVGVNRIRFISMFDDKPPKCDFVVMDEAQHSAAASCDTIFSKSGARFRLGLTATPFRTDRIKLAYEKIVSDCGIRFLVEQNYLSPFHEYVIPEFTPESIAKHFIQDREKWGKSVIYLINKGLCLDLDSRLKAANISSEIVMGDTPIPKQDEIFTRFEDGDIQVLINIYLLTEGFDAPDLRTVWIRDSGRLCTIQMAGRALRKDPNDPSKVANMVQSNQTRWSFTKTAKAKKEYVWAEDDSGWRGLEPGPQVELISKAVRERLLVKPVNLPSYLFNGSNRMGLTKKGKVKTSKRGKSVKANPLEFLERMDEGPEDN
jgi:superfamily II DNA or RNA helicase